MKIGIMSMQRVSNYGSFLQALGLKNTLEEIGHEVQFVDYHVGEVYGVKGNKFKNYIYKKIIRLNLYLKSKFLIMADNEKDKLFCEFLFNYEKKYLSLLNISKKKKYFCNEDILLIGSDEVFNCLQNNIDVGYSLDLFGKNCNTNKVISYAGSFGNTTYLKIKNYKIEEELTECFKNFTAISVRDNNSYNILKSLGFKNVYQHLDPVLVSDFSKYNIDNVKIRDYIIVYAYSKRIREEEAEIIKKFAKKYNKKLICIGGVQDFCDEFIGCSPLEILAYFKHADYIITDTFHGSIFSIKNGKQFVSIIRTSEKGAYGNEEKLKDLLEKLKLSERNIVDINNLEELLLTPIDYLETFSIIEKERNRTLEYLREYIK